MSLRMTEEEYAELMRRRGKGTGNRERGNRERGNREQGTGNRNSREQGTGNREQGTGIAGEQGTGNGGTTSSALRAPSPEGEGFGKRGKYGNRRVEIDGKKFDSKHEAGAWIMLMQRVRAGELKCVLRQVPFDLPGGIRYYADFVTVRPDMSIEAVIDAKSEATKKNRVYINKKKQMKDLYGIEIVEV